HYKSDGSLHHYIFPLNAIVQLFRNHEPLRANYAEFGTSLHLQSFLGQMCEQQTLSLQERPLIHWLTM
ncbi:4682_t:CDS:2, partial [Gigaspora rosea]